MAVVSPRGGVNDMSSADLVFPPQPSGSKLSRCETIGTKPQEKAWTLSKQRQRSSSHGLLSDQRVGEASPRRKLGSRMQLPSFEMLGISAHKPSMLNWHLRESKSRFTSNASVAPHRGRGSEHRSQQPSFEPPVPFLGSSPLLTPPDDIDSIKWNNAVGHAAIIPALSTTTVSATSNTVGTASDSSARQTGSIDQQSSQGSSNVPGLPLLQMGNTGPENASPGWLDLGIGASISSIPGPETQASGITVISQTLPHPLQDSVNPHTAFTPTIQAIQSRFDAGQPPPYIRITHAVPPQFSLTNLPSSPPSTPNRQHGDDYFNINVFANAAAVPNYHLFDGNVDRTAPPSPAPIVPPSSVQVSLIERYIPPSTAQEHDAFFSVNGPSVLVDRLVELSPSGGSLLLIYPTRRGAQAFRANYVGPLLDNLLRTMVVVHDMSSDLAKALGHMPAINEMLTFEAMKQRLTSLCRKLSRTTSTSSNPTQRPVYHVTFASTHVAPLDRAAWSEWFLQQETPRMRAALKSYWQRGQKLPTSKDGVIPATLLRDVKICIEQGQYADGLPEEGVEVGVFVLKRTK